MDKNNKTKSKPELEHPTILESPELRKKKIKIQIIFFIVLIIVGFSIIMYGIIPTMDVEEASEISKDYDSISKTFRSYDNGDKFVISGKITNKTVASDIYHDTLYLFPGTDGRIKYELDNELEVYANDDAGEKGDTFIAECVVEDDLLISSQQYLKATTIYNPPLFIIVGLILIIIAVISIIILVKKLKSTTTIKSVEAHKVAEMYKSLRSKDDEDMMYLKLKAKNDKKYKKPRVKQDRNEVRK